jgi:hypothetical protein
MRRWLATSVGLCLLLGSNSTNGVAEQKHPVGSQGETTLVAPGKPEVRVTITTHEVDIGKPSDERPQEIRTSCTYSRYPCSVVDAIKITVDNKVLFIPRSVSCNLGDVGFAQIAADGREWNLTLTGGDASEGYVVRVTFDTDRVKKKTLWGSLPPDALLEELVYHSPILGE